MHHCWRQLVMTSAILLAAPQAASAQNIHFDVPGPEQVEVRSETVGDGRVDLVFPADRHSDLLPAVIFAIGYPDDATTAGPLFEHVHYRNWAHIVAGSGMVAVLYSVRDPVADLARVAEFVASEGSQLGIDAERVAMWSASGNVPTALHYLRSQPPFEPRAVVLHYGIMPTHDGFQASEYQDASARLGFALPAYAPNDSYSAGVPMLVVRAGLDASTTLLASIDRFMDFGAGENLDLRLINYANGQHSFDSRDDTPETRQVIAQTLEFLVERLAY